jgi:beta-glucosidase-like glycosyl hydrolase
MKLSITLPLLALVTFATASLEHHHLKRNNAQHHQSSQERRGLKLDTSNLLGEMEKVLKFNNEHERTQYNGFQGTIWPLNILDHSKHQNAKQSPQQTLQKGANEIGGNAFSPEYKHSPNCSGTGNWKDAVAKARKYIKKFTLEERVKLVTGVGWQLGPKPRCVGDIASNERVGFPGLCLEDSPAGVRFADLVSVFPAGITTAATFSSKLTFERGKAMGEEFHKKGVNVQLGPGMNLVRTAAGGRNWEMSSGDPYLTGESAYHTIKGIQSQGVQACAKHLVGNEQEINRNTYSSNIDARTLREIYLHPFLRSVQADVASMMCSYNLLNNSWACQNSELMNYNVKTEMGFQGYIMSDWGAQHSGVLSANSGLDMTMPGQIACCDPSIQGSFWGANLTQAVNNGSVDASRVEDMGVRILAGWYLLGQDKQYPKPNFDAFDPFYGDHITATTVQHANVIREIGAAGAVLLKNKNNALPLKKKMRKLAVVGEDAGPSRRGANEFGDRGGVDGTVGIGWGSGTADYSYFISPYEALQSRARQYNTGFYWSFDNFAPGQAMTISDQRAGVDAAIVFVHADSGEGYITVDGNMGDRNNLTLWANGDNLIKNVSSVNSNTIVVIHAPSQIDVEQWIENPNVTAVIHAHMAGAEAGNAIADVLYGAVNPSGRLPYTIAKKRSDYSADVQYFTSPDTDKSQIYYNEKLNIDYRHFDAENIQPRFEFGFGLSYTKFDYSNLSGNWLNGSSSNDDWNSRKWYLPLPDWLFEDVYEISFEVKNTGGVDGFEVPQVYLGFPTQAGEPPKVLRKFDRYPIKAGQTKRISYRLNRYDLSIWDVTSARWSRPQGDYSLFVGASSRDIRLTKKKL